MKSLLCAVIFLCAAGVSLGADAWASIEIFRQNAFSIEECEYLKTILPKYSNYLNNIIIAQTQGKNMDYSFEVWAEPYGEKAVSGTLYKPNGVSIPLKSYGGGFSYESDDLNPPLQFFSIADFAAVFPSGQYRVDIKFAQSGIISKYITVPDYNTTPFPDFPKANVFQDGSGQLILNWTSLADVAQYNVWADSLKGFNEVYDEDFTLNYPQTSYTALGIYKSQGNYEMGVTAYKFVGGSVDFITDKHIFSFKNPLPVWNNAVGKCTVTAGTKQYSDSISFSGTLAVKMAEFILANGDEVAVTIDSNLMEYPKIFCFPVDSNTFKKGKYNCKFTEKGATFAFSFDTKIHKMTFSAKNIDLTGLACPITVRIDIGDYSAQIILDEVVVNGTKLCPFQLMMGAKNMLEVTKYKLKPGKIAGTNTDTLTAQGIFTIDGEFNPLEPLVIRIGSQTFTVLGASFLPKNGVYSCKNAPAAEGGFVTAKLDYNKCTFTLAITKANITQAGVVNFEMDCFGNSLEGLETIILN